MKTATLKRTLWTVALLLAGILQAGAQEGLQIDKVFDQYGRAKGCKMVEMHDATLRGFQLHVYKSLTYKQLGTAIAPYLKADRRQAKKIREVVEDGRIVSGYYMMPSAGNEMNRYILFSYTGENSGAVIYIEGRLSPDDIMKMCYTRR
ncbi:MAG: hypothetical protein PUH24_06705 [Prevotellaceae bacterium]|nr:hypothetical protein [Prevotella sp.]MDD7257937.1 hypothetical protein [Prevotellaceae bacterium]MDY6129848.1 hypothetical protein [Prevotella sp.]